MTAHADLWIVQIDVPAESSFIKLEDEDPEVPGSVFEATLLLDDDYIDKTNSSLISLRGGFLNITLVTFSNAVSSSVRLAFHVSPISSFGDCPKVEGDLALYVENYPVGFSILKNQVEDDAVHLVRLGPSVFELPLTRHVLALPIGSTVHVLGTLKLPSLEVCVDQHLRLDKNVIRAEWHMDSSVSAAIWIESSSCF